MVALRIVGEALALGVLIAALYAALLIIAALIHP